MIIKNKITRSFILTTKWKVEGYTLLKNYIFDFTTSHHYHHHHHHHHHHHQIKIIILILKKIFDYCLWFFYKNLSTFYHFHSFVLSSAKELLGQCTWTVIVKCTKLWNGFVFEIIFLLFRLWNYFTKTTDNLKSNQIIW